jgi:hypothetical protein
VVAGDTVYVSINVEQSDTNETGILYSQAQFDATGKINGWTPWSKRAFPPNSIIDPSFTNAVSFFDVDATTGSLWAVTARAGNPTGTTVFTSIWDFGSTPVSLAAQLNNYLGCGCYSGLDLDAFTRDFNTNTPDRYALFGGTSKVIFARVTQSRNSNFSLAPQTIFQDFTLAENLAISALPQSAGAVTALEYSRSANDTDLNFFFAGTRGGLYVFSNNGVGFSVTSLSTVNLPPFSTGEWTLAPNITGSITAVKTLGNRLYVLSNASTAAKPFNYILYGINYASPVATMFAAPIILAQTGSGSFSSTSQFTGISLIATNSQSTTEQLVLTTNIGLYQSSTVGGVQGATSDATAAWTLLDSAFYTGISGIEPAVSTTQFADHDASGGPNTVWPWSLTDQFGKKTFSAATIHQLNGTTNAGPYQLIPENFNTNNNLLPSLQTLPPITGFWTDGTRRLFIVKQPQDAPACNRIMSLPWDVFQWDIIQPQATILDAAALTTVQAIYWLQQIGATGILMAGTNKGVVALE